MKILIDTHIFLWFINDDPQFSPELKALLESDIDIILSIASLWEIAIKVSLNKLKLPGSIDGFLAEQIHINQIELLPITISHLAIVSKLPLHHRDPFDRLIIAQSIAEAFPLVSVDSIFAQYPIHLL